MSEIEKKTGMVVLHCNTPYTHPVLSIKGTSILVHSSFALDCWSMK